MSETAMKDGPDRDFSFDLFWTFRSPYCYLALDRILEIARNFEVFVNVRPVYPIALRDPSFFKNINKKYRRYNLLDTKRVAEYLDVPFRRPVPDPIIQDMETNEVAEDQPYITKVTLLGAAAQVRDAGLPFLDTVARSIWDGGTDNWHTDEKLIENMNAAGLNGHALMADIEADPGRFEDVVQENQRAHEASDHWGAPLMVFRGETFFGQDRIDILLWRMMQAGLPERR